MKEKKTCKRPGEWLLKKTGYRHYFYEGNKHSVCSDMTRDQSIIKTNRITVDCPKCLAYDHPLYGKSVRDLFDELLEVRRECKRDGIEWCRMESILAKFLRKCNLGYVCPNCNYPMVEKPSDNLCERCFNDFEEQPED